ncbi:alpha/beta fold hydrolase [Pseudanabaena yagii]|uniref:Alpha/beta hydrolase n=1 Tax=Pseudanabaena yagii GIHE-NHR1 TaxID=2722753 RepID=A0ABX1M167_9CYAN|nr:alpha/beta hydrolase [Pseudanabaena yagii]NMF60779.1 alpha/beta hydrolase [Pseudanabaena yagii GIHE-NHR1]
MSSDRRLKVLCLHGHPGNSEAMQTFVSYFRERGLEMIAPDLRGYGSNQVQAGFTMSAHIEDLWNLLMRDQADLEDGKSTEYLILGWSLGGILAIELALQNLANNLDPRTKPKIVGLILIATAAKPRSSLPKIAWWEYTNLVTAVILHLALSQVFSKRSVKPRWHIELFGKRSLIGYLIQQHTETAYDLIATTGAKAYLQTSRYAHRALMQALRQGYDRTQDLAKIQIPCLAIAAEQDRHITAASTAETAKLLPNCEFICYPQTAHLLPWEIGDRLLADIDAWIEKTQK